MHFHSFTLLQHSIQYSYFMTVAKDLTRNCNALTCQVCREDCRITMGLFYCHIISVIDLASVSTYLLWHTACTASKEQSCAEVFSLRVRCPYLNALPNEMQFYEHRIAGRPTSLCNSKMQRSTNITQHDPSFRFLKTFPRQKMASKQLSDNFETAFMKCSLGASLFTYQAIETKEAYFYKLKILFLFLAPLTKQGCKCRPLPASCGANFGLYYRTTIQSLVDSAALRGLRVKILFVQGRGAMPSSKSSTKSTLELLRFWKLVKAETTLFQVCNTQTTFYYSCIQSSNSARGH